MKEEQVISKLTSLKAINPSQVTLRDIKQGVFQQVKNETNPQSLFYTREAFGTIAHFIQLHKLAFYGLALVIVFVLISISFIIPNQFHTVILYSKLAFAPNQYQKSRIALQDVTSRFGNNKQTEQNTQELLQSLALANTELSNLKLKGVKGEYTQQECHKLYQEYLNYLIKEEKNIPAKDSTFSSVKSQINSYQEQAEKKLHMYSSS